MTQRANALATGSWWPAFYPQNHVIEENNILCPSHMCHNIYLCIHISFKQTIIILDIVFIKEIKVFANIVCTC